MIKISPFIILFIILFILLYVYYILYCKKYIRFFKKYVKKDDLLYIKTNNIQKIAIGPYITVKNKFYVYNPSIEMNNNGEIICASRVSSWTNSSCELKNKDEVFKKNKKMDSLDETTSLINNISSIVMFTMTNPENTLQLIHPFKKQNLCPMMYYQGLEDPRIFYFRNDLWIYCHYRGLKNNKCIHTPVIFNTQKTDNIISLYTDNMSNFEKNWMPFVYKDELYFEYMVSPHIILKCDTDTGYCKKVYEMDVVKYFPMLKYNNFGGGAPSKLIKIQGKEYFIGIAHTSGHKILGDIRKNFFYLFRAEPPFDIVSIGTEFNIIPEYKDIEFASGLLIKDNKVLVSCGISDCYGIIVEIDFDVVLDTLYIPFKNLSRD